MPKGMSYKEGVCRCYLLFRHNIIISVGVGKGYIYGLYILEDFESRNTISPLIQHKNGTVRYRRDESPAI